MKSIGKYFEEQEDKSIKVAIDNINRMFQETIIKPYKESEKYIDLHTHTNYSDGELSPNELISLALEKRLSTISITDHDTVEGVKRIDRYSPLITESGLKVINGVELSVKTDTGRMHLLGYGIDINNESLNKKMDELRDNSINSVISILEHIKKEYGITFGYEDIKKMINSNHTIGRADIALLCVKYGYASNVRDAFKKYLIDAYDKTRCVRKGMSYSETLDLIISSKGVPVLAHPKSLELSEAELLKLLRNMISEGLVGLEAYHSSHTPEEIKYYSDIANNNDLLISAGSDFHGPSIKPDIELGSGKNNNIRVKSLSLLNRINID